MDRHEDLIKMTGDMAKLALIKKAVVLSRILHSSELSLGSLDDSERARLVEEIQLIREQLELSPTDFHDLITHHHANEKKLETTGNNGSGFVNGHGPSNGASDKNEKSDKIKNSTKNNVDENRDQNRDPGIPFYSRRYCLRRECRHSFETLNHHGRKVSHQGKRCVRCGAPTMYILED
jgi:hypothetical protein